jgi:hypothetical protein
MGNTDLAAKSCSRVGQILPDIAARRNSRLSPSNLTGIRFSLIRAASINAAEVPRRMFLRPSGRPAPRLAPP